MYRITAANQSSLRNPLDFPGADCPRAFARQSLRLASGVLLCLLLTHLAGCESKVPSGDFRAPTLAQAGKNLNQPLNILLPPQQAKVLSKTNSTIASPPNSTPPVTLVIELSLATDSIDLAALQTDGQLSVPPLRLSADLAQAPLRAVLRELARKLDAKVYIAEGLPDLKISLRLKQVSIAEGIKQILGDTNYVVIHKKPVGLDQSRQDMQPIAATAIAEIRVFPKGNSEATFGQSDSLKAVDTADQTTEIEEWKHQALNAATAQERIRALKNFLEHTDPSQHDEFLLVALNDQDPNVRMLAIDSLADSTTSRFEPISQTALRDENPDVRMASLSVLLSRYGEESIPILEQALADSDTNVQQTARTSLEMAQRVFDLFNGNSSENSH